MTDAERDLLFAGELAAARTLVQRIVGDTSS